MIHKVYESKPMDFFCLFWSYSSEIKGRQYCEFVLNAERGIDPILKLNFIL